MTQLQFNQQCPVCGRRLLVSIALYGNRIQCPTCTAKFVANESKPCDRTLMRAEEALERAESLLLSSANN